MAYSRFLTNRSLVEGSTSDARRVFAAVSAATAAPSVPGDGYPLSLDEHVMALFHTGGTSPSFVIKVWWYSSISGQWHADEEFVVDGTTRKVLWALGISRVYLQVTSVSGTLPSLNAWLARVIPTAG
jgi:hypothetical protein